MSASSAVPRGGRSRPRDLRSARPTASRDCERHERRARRQCGGDFGEARGSAGVGREAPLRSASARSAFSAALAARVTSASQTRSPRATPKSRASSSRRLRARALRPRAPACRAAARGARQRAGRARAIARGSRRPPARRARRRRKATRSAGERHQCRARAWLRLEPERLHGERPRARASWDVAAALIEPQRRPAHASAPRPVGERRRAAIMSASSVRRRRPDELRCPENANGARTTRSRRGASGGERRSARTCRRVGRQPTSARSSSPRAIDASDPALDAARVARQRVGLREPCAAPHRTPGPVRPLARNARASSSRRARAGAVAPARAAQPEIVEREREIERARAWRRARDRERALIVVGQRPFEVAEVAQRAADRRRHDRDRRVRMDRTRARGS